MTQDNQWNTRRPNYQAFSGQYNEGAWSTEMNLYNVGGSDPGGAPGSNRSFSWPITFSNDGRQKFDTAVDDSGVCSIQGYGTQFNLGGFNAWTRRTTSDYIPAGSYIITMTTNNGGGGPWGVAADWVGYDPIPAPSLDRPSVNGLYNGYILRGTSVEVEFRVSYLDAQVSSTSVIDFENGEYDTTTSGRYRYINLSTSSSDTANSYTFEGRTTTSGGTSSINIGTYYLATAISLNQFVITGTTQRIGNDLYADVNSTLSFSWTVNGSVSTVTFDGGSYSASDSVTGTQYTSTSSTKTITFQAVGLAGDSLTETFTVYVNPSYNLVSDYGILLAEDDAFGNSASYSFTFTADGPASGTTYYWDIGYVSTTTNTYDFVQPESGSFSINGSGVGTFNISIAADLAAEGTETFTVYVRDSAGGTVLKERTLEISDTSVDVAVYDLTTDNSIMVENDTVTATFSCVNIAVGTSFAWYIDHDTSNSQDFVTTNGTFTAPNPTGSNGEQFVDFNISTVNDFSTEGDEFFDVVVTRDSIEVARTPVQVKIEDTSKEAIYDLDPGSLTLTESGFLACQVSTQYVPNNTQLYWTINHITTTAAEFGASQGIFNIQSNSGSFTITPVADSVTENVKTFSIQIRTGGYTGTIVETSAVISLTDGVTYNLTLAEGSSFTFTSSGQVYIPLFTSTIAVDVAAEGGEGATVSGSSYTNNLSGADASIMTLTANGGSAANQNIGGNGGGYQGDGTQSFIGGNGGNGSPGAGGGGAGLAGSGSGFGGVGSAGNTSSYSVGYSYWYFAGNTNNCYSCNCAAYAGEARGCHTAPDPAGCGRPNGWRCICACWKIAYGSNTYYTASGGGGQGGSTRKTYSRSDLSNFGYLDSIQSFSVNDGGNSLNNGYISMVFDYVIPQVTITSADATLINGESSTITWSSTDAVSQSLYTNSVFSGSVNSTGSLVVSPSVTTTYKIESTAYDTPSDDRSAEVTITVYQPPSIALSFNNNPIIRGQNSILTWLVQGDVSTVVFDQAIGSQNLSGDITVAPVETTTYSVTVQGLGGTLTDSITLTVYQLPTLAVIFPSTFAYTYGVDQPITVTTDYANTLVQIQMTYSYQDGTQVVQTTPLTPNSSASVSNPLTQTATPTVPWNSLGPENIAILVQVQGGGGSATSNTVSRAVSIDRTPDSFNIPASLEKEPGEEPIFAPEDDVIVSNPITINDIDIPVEIKANKPIQVRFDDEDPQEPESWHDVRQMGGN